MINGFIYKMPYVSKNVQNDFLKPLKSLVLFQPSVQKNRDVQFTTT